MARPPEIEEFSKEEIKAALAEVRHPVDVAVYGSCNYFNLGSIIRTSHNFLVRRIYAIDTKFYKKATMGSHKYEDVRKVTLESFETEMVTENRNVVCFERRAGLPSEDIRTYVYPDTPCLIFGSEKEGVPDELLKIAEAVVTIPVFGVHNDTNVSNAAAIAIYDFLRKHTMTERPDPMG